MDCSAVSWSDYDSTAVTSMKDLTKQVVPPTWSGIHTSASELKNAHAMVGESKPGLSRVSKLLIPRNLGFENIRNNLISIDIKAEFIIEYYLNFVAWTVPTSKFFCSVDLVNFGIDTTKNRQ